MQPKPIQVIDLAIAGAIAKIRDYQERILLKERFGDKAVFNVDWYEPGNDRVNRNFTEDLEIDYKNVLELASELKAARDNYFDQKFEAGVDEILKGFRKK